MEVFKASVFFSLLASSWLAWEGFGPDVNIFLRWDFWFLIVWTKSWTKNNFPSFEYLGHLWKAIYGKGFFTRVHSRLIKEQIVQFSQMSAILYCELTASVKDQSSPAAKIGPKIGVISNRWQHIEGNQWQIWQMFYTTYSPCVINHISANNVYYCNTRV